MACMASAIPFMAEIAYGTIITDTRVPHSSLNRLDLYRIARKPERDTTFNRSESARIFGANTIKIRIQQKKTLIIISNAAYPRP